MNIHHPTVVTSISSQLGLYLIWLLVKSPDCLPSQVSGLLKRKPGDELDPFGSDSELVESSCLNSYSCSLESLCVSSRAIIAQTTLWLNSALSGEGIAYFSVVINARRHAGLQCGWPHLVYSYEHLYLWHLFHTCIFGKWWNVYVIILEFALPMLC